jgi:hypothetical protein
MNKIARYIECTLGIFFLISAGMKAMNVEGFAISISAYGVLKDSTLVNLAAYFTLALESILGTALVAGWRKHAISFKVSLGLTIIFSLLITYAWLVNGLIDCGCFGDYIKMNAPQSLAKNALITALTAYTWYGLRNAQSSEFTPKVNIQCIGVLGALIVLAITMTHLPEPKDPVVNIDPDKDITYTVIDGENNFELAAGNYLIAFLNTDCDHCKDSVPGLTELAEDDSLPTFVALMMGDEAKLDTFIFDTEADFPMQLIPNLEFMEFIKVAPPILYFSQDGILKHHWEWQEEPPVPSAIAQDVAAQKE